MAGERELEFLLTGEITGKISAFWSRQACKTLIPWAFATFGANSEQGLNREGTGKEQGKSQRAGASPSSRDIADIGRPGN